MGRGGQRAGACCRLRIGTNGAMICAKMGARRRMPAAVPTAAQTLMGGTGKSFRHLGIDAMERGACNASDRTRKIMLLEIRHPRAIEEERGPTSAWFGALGAHRAGNPAGKL